MQKIAATSTEAKSADITAENIAQLKALFPELLTESANGVAINVDVLKQLVGDVTATDAEEKYGLNWHGKRRARQIALTPSTGTLRPCPDESVDWDTTQNLMIEGDNLEVLKLLQKSYAGKVKMIYIDPPYNTGNDFIYDDDFAENADSFLTRSNQKDEMGNRLVANTEANGRFHSDWLSMIYPRLKLARNLLREDGLIIISIDDNEAHNLRKVCDEVFGEENFIAQNVWKKSYGGGAKTKHVVILHEYILMYAKGKTTLGVLELPPNDDVLKYYKFTDDKNDSRGPYRKQPLATKSMDERPNLRFPIVWDGIEIWPEKQWQWSKDRVDAAIKNEELVFTQKKDGWTVDYKQYLKDENGVVRGSKPYSMLEGPYTQIGTGEIDSLFGDGKVFSFPKPSALIKHFGSVVNRRPEEIVLHFIPLCIKAVVVIGQSNLCNIKRSGIAPLTHICPHIHRPHNPFYFTGCLAMQPFFDGCKHIWSGVFKI